MDTTPTVESLFVYPIKSCYHVQLQECEVDNVGVKYDRRFMIVYEDLNRFITQRKYPSLALLKPTFNVKENTFTLSAKGQEPLVLPLSQDVSKLTKRIVELWKDTLTVYDVGDEAGQWVTQFLANHREHDLLNDRSGEKNESIKAVRLVRLDDPKHGVYSRPAHPKLDGIHQPFSDECPISMGFNSSLDELNKSLIQAGTITKDKQITMNRFRNNINIKGSIAWEEDQWLVAKIGEVTVYIVQPTARCAIPNIDQETGMKDAQTGLSTTDQMRTLREFAEEPTKAQFCCDVIPLTAGKIRVGDKVEILERIPERFKQGPLP